MPMGIIAAAVAVPLLVICCIPLIVFLVKKRRNRENIKKYGQGLDLYLERSGPGWQEISDECSMKLLHPNTFDYEKFQELDSILGGGLLVYQTISAVNNERLVNSFVIIVLFSLHGIMMNLSSLLKPTGLRQQIQREGNGP